MRSRVAAARRILHIFLLILLLTGAGYWHWGLFPGSLKNIPIDAIRASSGLETDFTRVLYLPFYGIRIENPSLKDKDGLELFKARSIRVITDLPVFLKEDRILIRKIEVDSPITEFRLNAPAEPKTNPAADTTAADDTVATEGVSSPSDEAAPSADDAPVPPEHLVAHHPFVVLEAVFDDSFLPSNVYLNELEIRHGKIILLPADKENQTPIETLREIRFRTQLDKRPLIPVQAMFRTSFGRGDFKAEGLVDLSDGKHRLALSGNIDRVPSWAAPWVDARGIEIKQLRGDARLALLFDGESLITFRFDTSKAEVQAAWQERGVRGTFGFKTSGTYDFGTRRFDAENGQLEASGTDFTDLSEHLKKVRISSGLFTWSPDRFEFPRVLGIWENTGFSAEGGVDRVEGFPAKFTFRQNLTSLEPLRPILPKFFDSPLNPGSFTGKVAVQAELEGPIRDLLKNIRSVRADIREGSLSPAFFKTPLTGIAGPLLIEPLGIYSTQDLFFQLNGKGYTLSGQFNSAPGGAGKFSLTAPMWDANARFKAWPDRVQFSTLTLQSGASHAGAAGTLWLGSDPVINTDFRAHLVPDELSTDWQHKLPWLKSLKLSGVIDADGSARGAVKQLTGLTANVKARSKHLTYADHYVLEPIEADLRLDSGLLEVVYAKAGFYGGEARATGASGPHGSQAAVF
jgi:hypothetical protein